MSDQNEVKVQGISSEQFKFFKSYSTNSLDKFHVIDDADGSGNRFNLDDVIDRKKPAIIRNCNDYIIPKFRKNGTPLFPFTVAGMDKYVQVNIFFFFF